MFVIVDSNMSGLKQITKYFQDQINAANKNYNDSIFTFKKSIPSIVNKLKNIFIPEYLYKTHSSNIYNDHDIESIYYQFQ